MSLRSDILKGKKILYVEDDREMQNLFKLLMGERVKEIYQADNGQQAIQILSNKQDIDIVITDIEMPGMNGLELIDRLRENDFFPGPIVVVTSFNDSEHFHPKADAYMYKPITVDKIAQRLLTLIES